MLRNINKQQEPLGGTFYIFWNTFLDNVRKNRVSSTNGNFYWYDNVIVNETSFPDQIKKFNIDDPSRLSISNNLTGSASDNIVDSQGFIQPVYKTFIGNIGHQVGKRPLPPSNLTVD